MDLLGTKNFCSSPKKPEFLTLVQYQERFDLYLLDIIEIVYSSYRHFYKDLNFTQHVK
jgi:hypothetical protein